jgi:hypothetical protein
MPRAPIGGFVVLHAAGAIVRDWIGERVHGLAVGMELPIGTGGGEFPGDGEHVLGGCQRIVIAMQHEYPGANFRFREP